MFQLVPLLLLIGGALVLVGLVGGGLVVREFQVPKISGADALPGYRPWHGIRRQRRLHGS